MSKETDGKGSRRRKEDGKKFQQNYAEIFKKFRKEAKNKKKGKDKS